MAQGTRRGWVRTVFAGIGVVLCAGAIGCTDIDKPRDSKLFGNNSSKQPGAGLPGTAKLPGTPGSGLGTATNPGAGLGSGVQPAGGRSSAGSGFGVGNQPSGSVVNAGGVPSNVIPSVAPQNSGTPAYTSGGGYSPQGYAGSPSAPNLDPAATLNPPPPRDSFGPVSPPANPYNR